VNVAASASGTVTNTAAMQGQDAVVASASDPAAILNPNQFVSFAPAPGSPYPLQDGSTWPFFVAAGDFNNDGLPDFASLNSSSDVTTFLQSVSGNGFAATGTYPLGTATLNTVWRWEISTAMATWTSPSVPGTFLARGARLTISISSWVTVTASSRRRRGARSLRDRKGHDIVVGDFNNDTFPDIVVGDGHPGCLLFLGNGHGGFAAGSLITNGTVFCGAGLAACDLNGDGNLDLVTDSLSFKGVGVLLGDGHGGFTNRPGSGFQGGVSAYWPISTRMGNSTLLWAPAPSGKVTARAASRLEFPNHLVASASRRHRWRRASRPGGSPP